MCHMNFKINVIWILFFLLLLYEQLHNKKRNGYTRVDRKKNETFEWILWWLWYLQKKKYFKTFWDIFCRIKIPKIHHAANWNFSIVLLSMHNFKKKNPPNLLENFLWSTLLIHIYICVKKGLPLLHWKKKKERKIISLRITTKQKPTKQQNQFKYVIHFKIIYEIFNECCKMSSYIFVDVLNKLMWIFFRIGLVRFDILNALFL